MDFELTSLQGEVGIKCDFLGSLSVCLFVEVRSVNRQSGRTIFLVGRVFSVKTAQSMSIFSGNTGSVCYIVFKFVWACFKQTFIPATHTKFTICNKFNFVGRVAQSV